MPTLWQLTITTHKMSDKIRRGFLGSHVSPANNISCRHVNIAFEQFARSLNNILPYVENRGDARQQNSSTSVNVDKLFISAPPPLAVIIRDLGAMTKCSQIANKWHVVYIRITTVHTDVF